MVRNRRASTGSARFGRLTAKPTLCAKAFPRMRLEGFCFCQPNRARVRTETCSHTGRAKFNGPKIRSWLELNSISRAFGLEFVKVLIVTKVGHNGRVQA